MAERTIPGRAGVLLASLGADAELHDMYDERGSEVYHDLVGRDPQEIRTLVAQVRRNAGPVLELAAGSGRLTMPMLAAGATVDALELSPSMLRLLVQRLAAAPAAMRGRCTPIRGDMASFALDRTFTTVVLGTTSISLLDSAERSSMYRCVRDHLSDDGRFLVSTVDRDTSGSAPDEDELEIVSGSGRTYRIHEYWAPGAATRTVTVFPTDRPAPIPVCTSTIGVLPVRQLTAELAAAGLRVIAEHPLEPAGARHRDVLLEAVTVR